MGQNFDELWIPCFSALQKTFLYCYAHNFTSLLFIHEPAIKMSKALTNNFFIDESIDISQIISTIKEVDFFAGIYENQIVKWSIGITYFLGLFGCIALRFIIWFERSGQAGHFRTLVNQLVSYNLEQVRYIYFFKILNLEELYLLKSFPKFYRPYIRWIKWNWRAKMKMFIFLWLIWVHYKPLDPIMAIRVVEFSNRVHKIRQIFCIKINIPKGNFLILRIGLMGSLSSLQKSEGLKLITLKFHV